LIAVCGEALIDVVREDGGGQQALPGGGPFNSARTLARLGVETAFLGRLSIDAFGRRLSDLLAADGVDLSLATTGDEPTTVAVARLHGDGLAEYNFFVEGTAAPNLTRSMLPERLPEKVRALHVGTLGLVLEPMASTIAELVDREAERRVVLLDPNIRASLVSDPAAYRSRLERVMSHSTIVKASDADLAWLWPDLSYEAALERVLERGVRLVVVTLGADGALGATPGVRVRVSAPPVDVVDTIGAGDAFGAALLVWLHDFDLVRRDLNLGSSELEAALDFASLVASITCTRVGAEPPWRNEVLRASALRQL
jgi:fructokinase